MRRHQNKLNILLGIVLLLIGAFLTWKFISLFLNALNDADSAVTAAIIGAITTILVGLSATLVTQNQLKAREADEAHRPKKIEIYSGFLKIVQRLHSASNENVKGKPVSEKELLDFMVDFKTNLILWSSPGVINAFSEFETISKENSGVHTILPAVDKIYREMRTDIGLSNKKLPNNSLVKIYLTNPTELDEAIKNNGL